MNNDVLYLEADEEITAAIDRLTKMPNASVKIVVPKRSTLLQSIVNLKLLKKAADDAGKKLVLVTGDRTSTHLAGRVGLPVAATLTSSPETPEVTPLPSQLSDEIEAEDEPNEETSKNPLEEEAADPAPKLSNVKGQPLNVGNKPSYAKPMMVKTPVGEASSSNVPGSSRVPDFNKMQKRLIWGGVGVVAIVALLIVNYFIASATVTLFAQGSKIATSFPATVDPTIKTTDVSQAVLAAENLTASHDLTATTNATGKQDVGTKAGGTVTINNCYSPSGFTIPAGTKLTGSGKDFVTNDSVAVTGAQGNFISGCTKPGTGTVNITAAASGDSYNLAGGTTYSVAGYPNDPANGVVGKGAQMTGGVSKTVNVVTQADIDKAVADLLAKDKDSSQKDLENKVAGGFQAIKESFSLSQGAVTANPAVGAQADQTVVDVKVNYSELSVAKKDISEVLKAQELKNVGADNQIYDDGVTNLIITPIKLNPGAASTFTFATTAYGGTKLDTRSIAKQLAGKRYGDAVDIASKLPGVSRAEIKLSPPWASKLSRIASHIKVEVKVASNN